MAYVKLHFSKVLCVSVFYERNQHFSQNLSQDAAFEIKKSGVDIMR